MSSFVPNKRPPLWQTNKQTMDESAKRKSQKTSDEQGEGKKKKGTYDVLPDALNGLDPKDIVHIVSEEIVLDCDHESFKQGNKYFKAVSIKLPRSGDGQGEEKEVHNFSALNLRQLRKLAGALGVRNSSRMTKPVVLITMGELSKIGAVVRSDNEISAGSDTK